MTMIGGRDCRDSGSLIGVCMYLGMDVRDSRSSLVGTERSSHSKDCGKLGVDSGICVEGGWKYSHQI